MQAIQAKGTINTDHQLVVQLPSETKAGSYEVIVVLLERVPSTKKFSLLHYSDCSLPTEGMTFSRSEIYSDNGR